MSARARAFALVWLFVLSGCAEMEFERAIDSRGFELSALKIEPPRPTAFFSARGPIPS